MSEPLLLLFDGNNITTRAYFAHRFRNKEGEWETLQTSDGRESGALFGAIRAMQTYVRQYNPTHVLWTFDFGQSRYRLDIRPTYKGDRAPKPYDLTPQLSSFQRFLSLIGAMHYQQYEVEADDLMAEVALSHHKELPVVIVSADHDLRQLCRRNIVVVKPSMGSLKSGAEVIFTADKCKATYGLEAWRLPELWALTGDDSDNIKGIRGIGEKTGLKLLNEYGTLADVVENCPKVQPHAQLIEENHKLIQLPGPSLGIPFSLNDLAFDKAYSDAELREFLKSWEMNSLIKTMDDGTFWTERALDPS